MEEKRYLYIVRCPVCGEIFDEIETTPENKAMAFAMLANDGRREHSKKSQSCVDNPRWVKGWDVDEPKEIKGENNA